MFGCLKIGLLLFSYFFSPNSSKLKNNFICLLHTASIRFKDLPVTVEFFLKEMAFLKINFCGFIFEKLNIKIGVQIMCVSHVD